MEALKRCRSELAHLQRLLDSGHPERFNIALAVQDWIAEELLILEEMKMGTESITVETVDRKVATIKCNCGASEGYGHKTDCPAFEEELHIALGQPHGEPITFDAFCVKVRELLSNTAKSKGYNATGPEGPNMLFEFNARYFPGHALGEVIYKAVRFSEKRNLEDVLKAAAWLYLVWKHEMEKE